MVSIAYKKDVYDRACSVHVCENRQESCLAITSCLTQTVLPAKTVSVCFPICSFPASSCCQAFQRSFSHCFSMYPDTTINRRSICRCSVSSTWDRFLPACSFNLFLLTGDKHFSNTSIWGYRTPSPIKDVFTVDFWTIQGLRHQPSAQ